jgi:diacylglycerol O-acyltransferase / wax synthase
VVSLTGMLDVGINSCCELVPDVWDLVDDFEVALHDR